MKKTSKFIITVIFFMAFFSPSFAIDHSGYNDGYWPKSYFASLGFGVGYTRGDLNKYSVTTQDSAGNKSKVYPPSMDFYPTPDFTLGANIGFFTLSANFQYWKSEQELTQQDDSRQTKFWRIGFEFTYNFFWPEDFEIGVGLGYSYANLTVSDGAFLKDFRERGQFIGSGAGAVANIHYYLNDYIAIVPSFRIYENWYKNLYTKHNGSCDLDPYIWQTYFLATVAVQFQF